MNTDKSQDSKNSITMQHTPMMQQRVLIVFHGVYWNKIQTYTKTYTKQQLPKADRIPWKSYRFNLLNQSDQSGLSSTKYPVKHSN